MNLSHAGTRRDFFRNPIPELFKNHRATGAPASPRPSLESGRSLLRLSREAMHTDFEVVFPASEATESRRAGMAMLDEIERVENTLTIWRGFSDLAEVNAHAAERPVSVSAELYSLLKLCRRTFNETGGAYDVTSTPLTRCWGFFAREGRRPTRRELREARARVGFQYVKLDDRTRTVAFARKGIELNPASIGKGFALDRARRVARHWGLRNVLLNGGYSSALGIGAPPWRQAWGIDIRNPLDRNSALAKLWLAGEGFSCSGSEAQRFQIRGKTYGHLIDPRTGYPADGAMQVCVAAPTAAEAEAYSTAFYVLGADETRRICKRHPEIGVLIQHAPDPHGEARLTALNLGEDRLEIAKS